MLLFCDIITFPHFSLPSCKETSNLIQYCRRIFTSNIKCKRGFIFKNWLICFLLIRHTFCQTSGAAACSTYLFELCLLN